MKKGYWVLLGVMVLVGALLLNINLQKQTAMVPDVNAQMNYYSNDMDSYAYNGSYGLGNAMGSFRPFGSYNMGNVASYGGSSSNGGTYNTCGHTCGSCGGGTNNTCSFFCGSGTNLTCGLNCSFGSKYPDLYSLYGGYPVGGLDEYEVGKAYKPKEPSPWNNTSTFCITSTSVICPTSTTCDMRCMRVDSQNPITFPVGVGPSWGPGSGPRIPGSIVDFPVFSTIPTGPYGFNYGFEYSPPPYGFDYDFEFSPYQFNAGPSPSW